jgi:hypothetical protein
MIVATIRHLFSSVPLFIVLIVLPLIYAILVSVTPRVLYNTISISAYWAFITVIRTTGIVALLYICIQDALVQTSTEELLNSIQVSFKDYIPKLFLIIYGAETTETYDIITIALLLWDAFRKISLWIMLGPLAFALLLLKV